MRRWGLRSSAVARGATTRAAAAAAHWAAVLLHLRTAAVELPSAPPHIALHDAAVCASGTAGQWCWSARLLGAARQLCLQPNPFMCRAAVAACGAAGGSWARAVWLLAEGLSGVCSHTAA